MKKGKRLIFGLLACLMIGTLTGCSGSGQSLMNSDGGPITYKESELPEGYAILKEDGLFYKPLNTMGSEDNASDDSGNVYTWFTEEYDNAIPKMSSDDKLIFYSTTSRPSSVVLYKMTDYGYTVGTTFKYGTATGDESSGIKYMQFGKVYNPFSPIESYIGQALSTEAVVSIQEINGKTFKASMLVDGTFLKGLTKDAMYKIGYYEGTIYKSINIKADSHLFLQEYSTVVSSYTELKSTYFQINIPEDLAPGYYYIDKVGMFYYQGVIVDIDAEDIEDESSTGVQLNNEANTTQVEVEDEIPQESSETEPEQQVDTVPEEQGN